MNPKQYKDMMSHLTRPDTRPPEVQKAAAEKQFNSELDRKNKLKKVMIYKRIPPLLCTILRVILLKPRMN